MSVLVERSMGELNEEQKPVYPLFQKAASMFQCYFVDLLPKVEPVTSIKVELRASDVLRTASALC
jgi:hypothetical protein